MEKSNERMNEIEIHLYNGSLKHTRQTITTMHANRITAPFQNDIKVLIFHFSVVLSSLLLPSTQK